MSIILHTIVPEVSDLGVNGNLNIGGNAIVDGNFGLGTSSPGRKLHLQGGDGIIRLDRDNFTTGIQLHRFALGDFTTPWKGFLIGVNASGVSDGEFIISDLGTNVSGGGTVRTRINNVGDVSFLSTTASTSATTGALVVSGGVGVSGGVNFANGSSIIFPADTANQNFPTTTTRSIGTKIVLFSNVDASNVDFGFGIGPNSLWYSVGSLSRFHRFYHGTTNTMTLSGSSLEINHTTASSSTTTGALRVSGGAGIAGNLYVGGELNVGGNTLLSDGKFRLTHSSNANYIQSGSATGNSAEIRFGELNNAAYWVGLNSSQLYVSQTTASTSTTSGALRVVGGVGVAGAMHIGGNVGLNASASASNSRLTINPLVIDASTFNHSEAPLTVTQPSTTGNSILNDPKAVLHLARQGKNGESFGARATFALSRYENNSSNSRSRLDIQMAHDQYNSVNIMTMRSSGNVGITGDVNAGGNVISKNISEAESDFIGLEDQSLTTVNTALVQQFGSGFSYLQNNYIQLTSQTNAQTTHLYWQQTPGNSLSAQFDIYYGPNISGADGVSFGFYQTGLATSMYLNQNGFLVYFSEFRNEVRVYGPTETAGTTITGVLLSSTYRTLVPANTWATVNITYAMGKLRVYINGNLLGSVIIQHPEAIANSTGRFITLCGMTGSVNNLHRVRNIEIKKSILDPTSVLTNEGFKLTSTWVGLGDSFMQVRDFYDTLGEQLPVATGTTIINRGLGGTTINYLTATPAIIRDLTGLNGGNPAYANYSSIIHFGVNDYRNFENRDLVNRASQYMSCCLTAYLTASVPYDKVVDVQTFTKVSGDWVNNTGQGYGVRCTQLDSTITGTVTGRYIAVTLALIVGDMKYEIRVDNQIVSNVLTTGVTQMGTLGNYGHTVLIDMGTVATRQLLIAKRSFTSAVTHFVNYIYSWDGDETNMRDVLVINPPLCPADETNENFLNYRRVKEAMSLAVDTCRSAGLPVYQHEVDNARGLFYDGVHLTTKGFAEMTNDVIKKSIFGIKEV